jgi:hypothetical protein
MECSPPLFASLLVSISIILILISLYMDSNFLLFSSVFSLYVSGYCYLVSVPIELN